MALAASIWICTSFWGALDTAFARIYHTIESRKWVQQKRFALAMLLVSLLFIAASVLVPALQSILVNGAADLPLGLAGVRAIVYAGSLAGGVLLLFVILMIIYRRVPYERMPWYAVWPGALGATLAITVVDYAYPAYLSNISALAGLGTTLIFIVIVLLWFYVVAIIVLGGAVINAMRFEDGPPAHRPRGLLARRRANAMVQIITAARVGVRAGRADAEQAGGRRRDAAPRWSSGSGPPSTWSAWPAPTGASSSASRSTCCTWPTGRTRAR